MDYEKMKDKALLSCAYLADTSLEKAKTFKMFDFAIMKVCLFSLGALFGAKFSKTIKKFAPFVIILAVASYGYLIYKLFFKED